MPETTQALTDWDAISEPTEEMAAILVADLVIAREDKTIGKVATRVNRELSGTRSLFTKTARSAKKMEAPFMEALIKKDKDWGDIEVWRAMRPTRYSPLPILLVSCFDNVA